jgi:hypothetical protein
MSLLVLALCFVILVGIAVVCYRLTVSTRFFRIRPSPLSFDLGFFPLPRVDSRAPTFSLPQVPPREHTAFHDRDRARTDPPPWYLRDGKVKKPAIPTNGRPTTFEFRPVQHGEKPTRTRSAKPACSQDTPWWVRNVQNRER